jgi:hypothetical protein
VPCNCPFDFAPDRYPSPVLHLLTLETKLPPPALTLAPDAETVARRFATCTTRLADIQREHDDLRHALLTILRALPDRAIACPGGRYRLIEREGIEELLWEKG